MGHDNLFSRLLNIRGGYHDSRREDSQGQRGSDSGRCRGLCGRCGRHARIGVDSGSVSFGRVHRHHRFTAAVLAEPKGGPLRAFSSHRRPGDCMRLFAGGMDARILDQVLYLRSSRIRGKTSESSHRIYGVVRFKGRGYERPRIE